MKFAGNDVISVDQFDREEVEHLFALAHRMRKIAQREVRCQVLDGHVLVSLFFEPSTRTRMSFESAFLRLGGQKVDTSGVQFSSMMKGESLEDTIRVSQSYGDVMVIRHPEEGSAGVAANIAGVPVINGGDGIGEHPTQALLDLFTIFEERPGKPVDGLEIAMVGDLKHGRTVHSLVKLLKLYRNVRFLFVAPEIVQMPMRLVAELQAAGCEVVLTDSMEKALRHADVVYMTRVQNERIQDESVREMLKQMAPKYSLNRAAIQEVCKPEVVIMHPLPRLSEINTDVDGLPGAAYFRQSDNGMLVRMALYLLLFDKEGKFV